MSLYDRDYMKSGPAKSCRTARRPGFTPIRRSSPSHRMTRLQAVGFVLGTGAITLLVLGMALS